MKKPLLIFDGDCHFCRAWIGRWKDITRESVDYVPYQDVAPRFPKIPLLNFQSSVQLVTPEGEVHSGAHAVFQTLAYGGKKWPLLLYKKIPGMKSLTEWMYRLVASHRPGFSWMTKFLWGQSAGRPSYFISRWFFLKLIAVIYLVALVSFWIQAEGLVGQEGILPFKSFLQSVKEQLGPGAYWKWPTLLWFYPGDRLLQILCGLGVVFSALLFIGVLQPLAAFFLWAIYLSLLNIGGDFLSFQWDILLLEAGFLAIFITPLQLKPNLAREAPPSPWVHWLFLWLLFRLMFLSGMVKWLSGDPTWPTLTALSYHYWTQPLPTGSSWYVHHFGAVFHQLSTALMFAIEIVIPFFIFGPARLKHVAGYAFVFLMVLIFVTGNYCFFNLLTIALCLFLFEDHWWPERFRMKWFLKRETSSDFPSSGWPKLILFPVLVVAILMTVIQGTMRVGLRIPWPGLVRSAYFALAPFHSFNSYGLFAVMTTTRAEIIIEGSEDGKNWLPYEFKYKPGDLGRRPVFVAPHQPRLDWQMWFAALGDVRQNPWFINLCVRLLQGSPAVINLMEKNPFSSSPPRFIRAVMYDYTFTTPAERRRSGNWWKRTEKGLYLQPISLRGQ